MQTYKPLKSIYNQVIVYPSKRTPFWILAGFAIIFLVARYVVYISPGLHLSVSGTHVHHLTYGIILLAISGFASLTWSSAPRRAVATIFGVGLGLTFDEFGMWLHLTTNYYQSTSLYVMLGILVFLVCVVYGAGIVRSVRRSTHS